MFLGILSDLKYAFRSFGKRKLSALLFPVVLGCCVAVVSVLLMALLSLTTNRVQNIQTPVQSIFVVDETNRYMPPTTGAIEQLRLMGTADLTVIAANTSQSKISFEGLTSEASVQVVHFDIFDHVNSRALEKPFKLSITNNVPAVISKRFSNRISEFTGVNGPSVGSVIQIGRLQVEVVNVVNSHLQLDSSAQLTDIWVPWEHLLDVKGLPQNYIQPLRVISGTRLLALGRGDILADELFWWNQSIKAQGLLAESQNLAYANGFHTELKTYQKNRQLVKANLIAFALLLALSIGSYLKLRLVVASSQRQVHGIRYALGANNHHQLRQLVVTNGVLFALSALAGLLFLLMIDTYHTQVAQLVPSLRGYVYWVALGGTLILNVLVVCLEYRVTKPDSGQRSFRYVSSIIGNAATFLFTSFLILNALILLQLRELSKVDYGFTYSDVAIFDVRTADTFFEGTNIRISNPMGLISENLQSNNPDYLVSLTSRTPLDYRPVPEQPFFFPLEDSSYPINVGVMHVDATFFSVLNLSLKAGAIPEPWPEQSIVINASLADRFFHETNPIGQDIYKEFFDIVVSEEAGMTAQDPEKVPYTIVGVVEDFYLQSKRISPTPLVLAPLTNQNRWHKVLVRPPAKISLEELEQTLQIDRHADVQVADARHLQELINADLHEERTRVSIALLQGVLSLLLFTLTVYVYLTEILQNNKRRIGIMNALGATPGRLSFTMVRQLVIATVPGFLSALVLGPFIAQWADVSSQHSQAYALLASLLAAATFAIVVTAFVFRCCLVINRAVSRDEVNSWIT